MRMVGGGPHCFLWNGRGRGPCRLGWGLSNGSRGSVGPGISDFVIGGHYTLLVPKRIPSMKRVAIITITEDTEEMHSLLDTLQYSVVKEYLQNRAHPHRLGFLGPGRIEEIEKEVKELNLDLVVVNGSLKPSQHHYLEMLFQMECMDRPGVILRIFADHAHTPEAIAQVTLAKLRYELPFLREWIHKAKSGDRPGFLAGGAYATDVYFEHAKTHSSKIETTLEELSRQRETIRTRRRAKGYSLVSLAGYTNVGKSALLNRMCGSDV